MTALPDWLNVTPEEKKGDPAKSAAQKRYFVVITLSITNTLTEGVVTESYSFRESADNIHEKIEEIKAEREERHLEQTKEGALEFMKGIRYLPNISHTIDFVELIR